MFDLLKIGRHLSWIVLCFVLWIPLTVYADGTETVDMLNPTTLDPMQSASEKSLVSVEPRSFTKAGRGEISLGLSTMANDIFVVYLPVTLRGGYHIKEWVSVELAASFMGCFSGDIGENQTRAASERCMRFLTPTHKRLTGDVGKVTQLRSVTVEQYQAARIDINPVFSLFMGKFSLADAAIVHFDMNVTAGLGVQIIEMLDKGDIGKLEYGASFEGNFGLGLRFMFLDYVGLRIDFREYLFGKKRDKGLGTASEFGLSVSFLL